MLRTLLLGPKGSRSTACGATRSRWAASSASGSSGDGNTDRGPVSILAWLSRVEVIQVDKITWTPGSPLHRPQVLERTYRNRHLCNLDIDRQRSKLRIRQNALQPLNHVQISEPCSDQRSLPTTQQRRDGTLRAEQRLPQLDVTTELSRNMGERVEILQRWIGDDVAVLRSPHHAPRSQRQAANDNEPHICLNEAPEKLIEQRCAQWARRAASRNSNSLRASEIVSSRFTTSGRRPSARSRSRRTRSPSTSCTCCFDRSAIEPNTTAPVTLKTRGGERYAVRPSAAYLRGRGDRDDVRTPSPPWIGYSRS